MAPSPFTSCHFEKEGAKNKTPEADPYQELKALSRQRMRLIWEMAQLGGPLEDEDARLVKAMREHREYVDLWSRLDDLPDEEIERDGVNPIMHVTIHQTIENQIAGGEPQAVRQVVEALMQQGLSRHEAIHRVGSVLAEEIWHILKDKRPFDEPGYVRKLRRLVKKPRKSRRGRRSKR